MRKKLAIADLAVSLLFGAYLLSQVFVDYAKPVRVAVSCVYLLLAVVRAFFAIRNCKKKGA